MTEMPQPGETGHEPLKQTVPEPEVWILRLYVAGQTARSLAALANLRKICEKHLEGRYQIEVIDLMDSPQLAERDQIFALPTLVRKLPPPMRKIIGDLSNTDKVLVGLNLLPQSSVMNTPSVE